MLTDLALLPNWDVDHWGAFGDVLGGVGSMLAVVVATILLIREVRARRREATQYADERREQEEEQREREARQRDADAWRARLVLAELGESELNPDDQETQSQWINVLNESDGFVFDVIVRIPGSDLRRVIHYIKPGSTESTDFRGLPDDYYVMHVSCGGPLMPYQLRAIVEFTDPSGRRWRRHGWDQPQRLPDELADSALYHALPPFAHGDHEYDRLIAKLGVENVDSHPEKDD